VRLAFVWSFDVECTWISTEKDKDEKLTMIRVSYKIPNRNILPKKPPAQKARRGQSPIPPAQVVTMTVYATSQESTPRSVAKARRVEPLKNCCARDVLDSQEAGSIDSKSTVSKAAQKPSGSSSKKSSSTRKKRASASKIQQHLGQMPRP